VVRLRVRLLVRLCVWVVVRLRVRLLVRLCVRVLMRLCVRARRRRCPEQQSLQLIEILGGFSEQLLAEARLDLGDQGLHLVHLRTLGSHRLVEGPNQGCQALHNPCFVMGGVGFVLGFVLGLVLGFVLGLVLGLVLGSGELYRTFSDLVTEFTQCAHGCASSKGLLGCVQFN
jgi:hypothetical protein